MTNESNKSINIEPIRSKAGARLATSAYSRFGIAVTALLVVAQLLASFLGSQTFFDIVRRFFGLHAAYELFGSGYYLWIIQVVCMYVVGYPVFRICLVGIPTKREKKSGITLAEMTVAFLACMASMGIGAYIGDFINDLISVFTNYVPDDAPSIIINDSPIWVIVLVVVIIGPIFEELMFRRVFIDKLSRFGERLAIVSSAIAFGLFHGNFSQLFYTTMIGLVLGYVYAKTRRVRYSVIIHMLINFVGTVPAMLLSDDIARINELLYLEELTDAQAIEFLIATLSVSGYALLRWVLTVLGVVTVIIALAKKKISLTPKNKFALRPLDVPRVTVFNLGSLIFLAFSAFMLVLSVFPIGGLY